MTSEKLTERAKLASKSTFENSRHYNNIGGAGCQINLAFDFK